MNPTAFLWLALSEMPWSVSGRIFRYLRLHSKTLEAFSALSPAEMSLQAEISPSQAARFSALAAGSRELGEKRMEELRASGARMAAFDGGEYPPVLRCMADPPPVLYIIGKKLEFSRSVAMVGARKADAYGMEAAMTLASGLAREDVLIVSGMARGIDTAAHRGALREGGCTAAVLGCGADVVYPRENARLYEEIIAGGAVISEFPPGTEPARRNFPRRNRIIAGLAAATVVVQADSASGSLLTAGFAIESGREVLAVPGSIFNPLSRGTHALIRDGAAPAASAEDVLQCLGWQWTKREVRPDFSDAEKRILSRVNGLRTGSDIAECCNLEPAAVLAALSVLEIKGAVRKGMDGIYIK